jgi:hypothetical protein
MTFVADWFLVVTRQLMEIFWVKTQPLGTSGEFLGTEGWHCSAIQLRQSNCSLSW